jgi:molybdopterin/thiamine biosynthesis adenylyltransferase
MTKKIKVIGCGGIGCWLVDPLSRYLSSVEQNSEITIIDGDNYEERNRSRQKFSACGNKAEKTVEDLKKVFPRIHFKALNQYLTKNNVHFAIRENDVVFMCVDNHATRKLVSDRCSDLDNVILISGGNDLTTGDVLIYWRQDGIDLTPPLTALREIAEHQDKNPGEFTEEDRTGCMEESISNPQLLFMNLDIASCMLNCYYAYDQGNLNYYRVYSDILAQARRGVKRVTR